MRAGAALLVGVHDFTQFSNNSPERLRRNPVKQLTRFEVLETDEGLRLEVGGSGWLRGIYMGRGGALQSW
jgi:tRNA U38,U39,U40 pseudouridine synthase TruA